MPSNYMLVADLDFREAGGIARFDFSDPAAWGPDEGGGALELVEGSAYAPPHRSPTAVALLRDLAVRDFVLEAEVRQTGREYGHRDLCFFFGWEEPDRFYYAHLASEPDERAHNVFVVDRTARRSLAPVAERGVDWDARAWHTVRIERTLGDGAMRVFVDDLVQPALAAADDRFGWGRIGFGSFDDSGRIRRLRVWAPVARVEETTNPFAAPAQGHRPRARRRQGQLGLR